MTELIVGAALAITCAQMALSAALWCELRGQRQISDGLAELVLEIENTKKQMVNGIIGAITERAMADDKPAKGSTAH